MTNKNTENASNKNAKEERLSAALRENLKRRKLIKKIKDLPQNS
jgi:hypothetical protein